MHQGVTAVTVERSTGSACHDEGLGEQAEQRGTGVMD